MIGFKTPVIVESLTAVIHMPFIAGVDGPVPAGSKPGSHHHALAHRAGFSNPNAAAAEGEAEIKSPVASIEIVVSGVAVSHGPGDIFAAFPRAIVIAGAVDHNAVIDV